MKRTILGLLAMCAGLICAGILYWQMPCWGSHAADGYTVSAATTRLRIGETTQLVIKQKLSEGTRDLTGNSVEVNYGTTADSRLVPEPDGKVTCIGTDGKRRESGIININRGYEEIGAVTFCLYPEGVGPSLDVAADKLTLSPGESTSFHVLRRTHNKEEVARNSATRYLVLTGNGIPNDPHSGVKLDPNRQTLSAPASLGRANRISVVLFARNGADVGWAFITVLNNK